MLIRTSRMSHSVAVFSAVVCFSSSSEAGNLAVFFRYDRKRWWAVTGTAVGVESGRLLRSEMANGAFKRVCDEEW